MPTSTALPRANARGTQQHPFLELTWRDPVTGRRGYLVIDRLVRGVCSGGLRMREGCTLDEVRGLAAAMTLKEGLHYRPDNRYVPLGGAKGGIDCGPQDPDAKGVLRRYLQGVRPLLERYWTTGEDLGLQQSMIDEAIADLGMRSSIQAVYPLLDDETAAVDRMRRAFTLRSGGIGVDELVGGLGVAESVLNVLEDEGRSVTGTRVVVQGFGSMGGATARFLAQSGMLVVGVADAHGTIENPQGLDVEGLLARRTRHGEIDRSALRKDDRELALDAWLDVPTDVLVPAAISYCITPENQSRISARLIAEAANLPVLPAAEATLADRGVRVIPDFVANSATNAWWWWMLFGDIDADVEQSFTQTRSAMRVIVSDVLSRSKADGTTLRKAAMTATAERLDAIAERFGDN